LVDKLALYYRSQGERVGILAIDPSSPFSGGAILGDRIRMQSLGLDANVFIRSMATRGSLGGVARATADAATILDAAGFDRIIVETVGVGQDEVEIVKMADVTVVVLVPGMGDDIQAIKAGIMEIGDLFVINKADRDGVLRTEKEIEHLLSLGHSLRHSLTNPLKDVENMWQPPIVKTIATQNQGIEELAGAINAYDLFQKSQPESSARRKEVARWRIFELLRERIFEIIVKEYLPEEILEQFASEVAGKDRSPYAVVDEIVGNMQKIWEHQDKESEVTLAHLGIATDSIEDALVFWRDALGLEVTGQEAVPDQKVRVTMLPVGTSRIELLESIESDSPIEKFLIKRGSGLHHIALHVKDIERSLDRLKKHGIRLIDETPRVGAEGARIAFIHPSSASGVLVELVQQR
ncbi:MAG: methylmalonyl Co-A mutase-associated GTPase MeaB, partial [Pyrinomonadaceae bacterium]